MNHMDAAFLDRAQGCLLGQLCGDALGAQVEFRSASSIRQEYPDGVTEMRPGGPFKLLAGQVTDDSEMALMLARMLIATKHYSPLEAASYYLHWYRTNPPDIGVTTSQALKAADAAARHGNVAADAAMAAANQTSQANGALMRISPLGIFGHAAHPARLMLWARTDAQLTHPHRVCLEANAAYVRALQVALQTGDPLKVYEETLTAASEFRTGNEIVPVLQRAKEVPPTDYQHQQGYVLTALQNAFYQLLHSDSAEKAILDTVWRGGDTDTNAAIAGALAGATFGRGALPVRWVQSVLDCRPAQGTPGVNLPRPPEFWATDALEIVDQLLESGPK